MASSSNWNSHRFSETKFSNWLKAALGVLITKQGITPFVYDEIKHFQQKCLSEICESNGLTAGTTCSSCCTENVVVCPTDRICNVGSGKCSYHDNDATQYLSSGCPNKICHNFKNEIQKAHRSHRPSYYNTDASQWCSKPWEVAKCFIFPRGYKDVETAVETDFNGLCSAIVNFEGFQLKVHDDLSYSDSIVDQARETGEAIRHSPYLEVEFSDLLEHINTLQDLLTDPGYLATDTAAQKAYVKLLQLQTEILIIDKDDVQVVLEYVAEAIRNKIGTEKDEYKKELEIRKLKLIESTKNAVSAVNSQERVSISELDEAVKSVFDEIRKASGEKYVKGADEGLPQIIDRYSIRHEDRYEVLKNELKKDLIAFYTEKQSTVSLSPLFDDQGTPVVDFYILPKMKFYKDKLSIAYKKEVRTPVKSLLEIFKSGDKFLRELYLTGDPGCGKTAFAKFLTASWCQAQCPDSTLSKYFKEDVLNILRPYDFLFLVFLRDAGNDCSIDDLLMTHITKNIPRFSKMPIQSLQEVLHNERHLVILDGLDDWSHPEKHCTRVPKSIPHRNAREKCVVLTTTRPWKLSVLSLCSSQIKRLIELQKLSSELSNTLKERAVSKMKRVDVVEAKHFVTSFDEKIEEYGLQDLESVPLYLMYLVSSVCDDGQLGHSRCAIFTSIIELLLSRKNYPDLLSEDGHSQTDIPQCFSNQENCKKYCKLLVGLGQVAFEMLFSEKRENTLEFDSSFAEKCLSKNEFRVSLLSGILTRRKIQFRLTRQSFNASFSHKSVEEYFAALYISCQSESDVQKIILQHCKSLGNIIDMSGVLVFISGMNAEMISSISRELMPLISEDKLTNTHRSTAEYNSKCVDPLKDIQNMFVSCMKENPDSDDLGLYLQDVIIDEKCWQEDYKTNLQRLAKQNTNNIKSVQITDRGFGTLHEIIDSFGLSDLNNLQKINYRGICKEEDIMRLLSGSVTCVGVVSPEWRNEDFIVKRFSISSTLCRAFHGLPHLQGIYFDCFEMNHYVLEEFFSCLVNKKSVKEIGLYSLYCTDHGTSCDGISLDLSRHSDLRMLGLEEIPLTGLNINISSLEMCRLGELSKPDLVSSVLSRLPEGGKLNRLTCQSLQSPGDIETLLRTLPLLVQLKDLRLLDINLGERFLRLSPQMASIEDVLLEEVTMSCLSLRDLVRLVEQLPHSVTVEMLDCNITPETEFVAVKEYIKTSENFVVSFDGVNQFSQHAFVFVFVKSEVGVQQSTK